MHDAPPLPDCLNQRCDDLPFPERMLLWSFRVWVVGLQKRIPVDETLHAAFDRYGATGAVGLIDNFMAVVSHGAARPIAIDCPCRAEVSGDERLLLAAAALYQSGPSLEAPFILRSLLTPTASRLAADLLRALADVLTRAGLRLGPATLPAGRYGLHMHETAFLDGPSRMIH